MTSDQRMPRDFGLLAGAQALSSLGSETSRIAYPLLILTVTDGHAASAGLALTALLLGQLAARLPGGLIADVFNRRTVMISADAVRLCGVVAIAIMAMTETVTIGPVCVVAALQGIMDVFFSPAETGALKAIVPSHQMDAAMVTYGIRDYAVVLAGPAIGGLLFAISPALPFLFDAFSYVLSVAMISAIRTPLRHRKRPPRVIPSRVSLVAGSMLGGFRLLWRMPFLRDSVISACLLNFSMASVFYVVVVVLSLAGTGASQVGLVMTIGSGFGLVGAAASRSLLRAVPRRMLLIGWGWSVAASIAAMLVVPLDAPWLFGLAVGGTYLLAPAASAIENGYRVAATDLGMQGRVDAASTMLATCASPLGPLAAGLAYEVGGAEAAISVPLVAAIGAATFRTVTPSFRAVADPGTVDTSRRAHGSGSQV